MEQNMEQNTEQYEDIFAAIYANDIEAVKTFLPDQLEMSKDSGLTPLHYACGYGRTKITGLLLDYGANIQIKDFFGFTALHWACYHGCNRTARLLLDRGANIEAMNNNGDTPLHLSCDNDKHKTSEMLVKRGADPLIFNNDKCSALDFDRKMVKDKDGNKVPHRDVLTQLRADYLNKYTISESERTGTISSGWEMEL